MAKTEYATCTLCEASCGIEVELEGGGITAIRGDAEDPMSRGYVCPKVMGLKDVHDDPDRLRTPLIRRGSGFEPIGWDDAFDHVVSEIRRVRTAHGKHSLALYQGNPTVHNLGLMTYGQMLFRRLGTRHNFSATSTDQLPHMLSSLLMFGHQLLLPIPDIDHTDLFVVFGANPLVSNGSVMSAPNMRGRLQALQERGGRVVVVDPRRTETAARADEHIFVRPGTDALVLMAMVHTLFDEDLVTTGHLGDVIHGIEDIRDVCREFSPERVADRTGVEAPTIRRLARDLAAPGRAVCYGRIGVSTQEFGGLCSWLINAINLLTGHFDTRGGAMFTSPAVDLVAGASKAGLKGTFNRFQSRVRGLPEFGGELPVACLAEEIETPGDGQIRALIASAGNPVLSIPNGARLDRALPGLEFMVSLDFYINETSRHAHVILPPTCATERDHYELAFHMLGVRNTAKWCPALIPRGPDQRHDWEICLELMSRLVTPPGPLGAIAAKGIRAAGRAVTPRGVVDLGLRLGPYNLSVRKLMAAPHGVDLGPLVPRLPGALETPEGTIELCPEHYVSDVPRLRAALDRDDAGGLSLIGRRQLRSNNSWLHNSRRLVKGKPRCTLLMNPSDAERMRLEDGADVVVKSRVGQVVVPLEITGDMMPGVVSLPHGWGHDRDGVELAVARAHAGASVNDITDEGFIDELSGNSSLSGVPVEVSPA